MKKPRKKIRYIQYSKRFAACALLLGYVAFFVAQWRIGDNPTEQIKAFLGLLEYTFGIVAVYNGNSISEKFFVNRYHLFSHGTKDDDING
ncbi:MAG: hypothetical protein GXY67_07810 [Clostridiales bacterium]|nr:hypothetical protein [Clostridiales bacterium]